MNVEQETEKEEGEVIAFFNIDEEHLWRNGYDVYRGPTGNLAAVPNIEEIPDEMADAIADYLGIPRMTETVH